MGYNKEEFKEIPFNGKCILSEDPSSIGSNYQSLKNFFYYKSRIRGVGGMSKINTTQLAAAYRHLQNGFHFVKNQPAETHVIVQATDGSDANPVILENTTAIASQGDFSATILYTQDTSAGKAEFSKAPHGQMMICDAIDALIWGGNEKTIGGFVNFDDKDAQTRRDFFWDFTDELSNTKTEAPHTAVLNPGTEGTPLTSFYLGSTRPLKGAKFYVDVANSATNTMTVKYWASNSTWTAVSNFVDNTHDGTGTFEKTGGNTMTWDSTVATAYPKMINEVHLYWYKFQTVTAACSATTELYQVTVDAPMQKVIDLWDGSVRQIGSCKYFTNSEYLDKTTNVTKDETSDISNGVLNQSTFIDLGAWSTTQFLYCGFHERTSGILIHIPDQNGTLQNNENAITLTISYWSGKAWTSVGTLDDGTLDRAGNTKPFNQGGWVFWTPPDKENEYKTSLDGETPMYYYRLSVSAGVTNILKIHYIAGATASKSIRGYKFSVYSKGRVWLGSNQDGAKNSATCSAYEQPDVYNGEDSKTFIFGDDSELVGGIGLYDLSESSIYDVTLFYKSDSMFGIRGTEIGEFVKYTISETIGLTAPSTLKVAQVVTEKGADEVAIWQGSSGIYLFSGKAPQEVSGDIANFWDETESNDRKLHADYADRSVSFIDKRKMHYHWLFADGNSTGILNREWVLDLKTMKLFEIERHRKVAFTSGGYSGAAISVGDTITNNSKTAVVISVEVTSGSWAGNDAAGNLLLSDQTGAFASGAITISGNDYATATADSSVIHLQCGFPVQDTVGNDYNYGCIDTGYMERLENGNDFDGTDIAQKVKFGDMALAGLMHQSQVLKHKLIQKDTETTDTVAITHYGDSETSGTALTAVDPTTSDRIQDTIEKLNLGEHIFHSFEYIGSTDDQNPGLEFIAVALKYLITREDLGSGG